MQKLAYGMRLAGAVHYEVGDNDIAMSNATGQFNSDRLAFEGRLDKRFSFERCWIEPAVQVLYARDNRDGYTDSNGTAIAGSSYNLGRLRYGPKIGTTLNGVGAVASFSPFVKINGVWDFERPGAQVLSTGVVQDNASTALNLGGGTEVAFVDGARLSVAADWYGFNTSLQAWSVTGSLGAPLSAFSASPASCPASSSSSTSPPASRASAPWRT